MQHCLAHRYRVTVPCAAASLPVRRGPHSLRVLSHGRIPRTRSSSRPIHITCQLAGAVPNSPLSTLTATKKFDRIRSQAKLVFDHYDQDKDGVLTASDLDNYAKVVDARGLGESVQALLKDSFAKLIGSHEPAASYDFEQFEGLYRQQVELVQQYARLYLAGALNPQDVEKTKFDFTLKDDELAAAHWAYKSMDFENTGVISVDLLERVPGIEGEIVQAKVLEEVDGPSITFNDYLRSYAKPKPVFLNMTILLAHTATMYFILQLPLDLMLKGVLVAVVFLRPQLITNAVIHVYNIVQAIVMNVRANMAMNQGGSSRLI